MDSQLHYKDFTFCETFVFVGIRIPIFIYLIMKKEKKFRLRIPLWVKTFLVVIASVFSISAVAVVYSSNKIKQITRESYIKRSVEIADTMKLFLNLDDIKEVREKVDYIYTNIVPENEKVPNSKLNTPELEHYISYYEEVLTFAPYLRLLDQIAEFHQYNDAKYLYVCYSDFTNKRNIYLADDSPEEDRCLPGSYDDFSDQDMSIFDDVKAGFQPEISNTPEYGYLVSTGRPIFENETDTEPIAFSLVDLSMDEIKSIEQQNSRTLRIILLSMCVAVIIITYLLVLFFMVRPIRKLTRIANEYTYGSSDNLNKFSKVKIHTRDEIEDLSNSMKKMEADINHYISDLLSATTKLEGAERKADELKYIADRDALTGVMNKRGYFEAEEKLNIEIKQGKAKFAITMIDLNDLKLTNDTLGHEKGDTLIIATSSIIKKVFALSTVYRVGGDEFVVISQNEDYTNIHKLEKIFLTILEQSSTEDIHLSAAIGVATFNKVEDNNVEDVFKRADSNMYKMKKKMKGK